MLNLIYNFLFIDSYLQILVYKFLFTNSNEFVPIPLNSTDKTPHLLSHPFLCLLRYQTPPIMDFYRAPSLFQPSNLVEAMNKTMDPSIGPSYLYGSILAFPHTMVARTIAVLGMDFVMVDALHTYVNGGFSFTA